MKNVKRNVKDSVFTKMFGDKTYLLQLFESIHPEDKGKITENDLTIVTLENVLTDGIYNDLGFLVKDKLVVFVEAQSTWSDNIIVRMIMYLANTYQEYIYSDKKLGLGLYGKTAIKLPAPELYVIYTGNQEGRKDILSLKEDIFKNASDSVDLKAKVIFADENRKDIIGQYISFCTILKEQVRLHSGDTRKAVKETIRICIEKGNLKEYLSLHKREVEDYMFTIFTDEEIIDNRVDRGKYDSLKDTIRMLKRFVPTFEDVYDQLMSEENTAEFVSKFSKEAIKELYDEA